MDVLMEQLGAPVSSEQSVETRSYLINAEARVKWLRPMPFYQEKHSCMDLTDEQWEVLEPLIPDPPRREDRRGRPWRDPRDVLNGILWILRTGAPWKDLPERYPPYQTCHRRFQRWIEEGVLGGVLEALAEDLEKRGQIDLSECYIDGTFVVAKKGGQGSERPSGAKVARSWRFQTALLLHSPSTRRVLARTKSPLLGRLWSVAF
jgi:transposase